jgi:hypothetical protein
MKIFKIFIFTAVICASFSASCVFAIAVKNGRFPNSSQLQPPPINIGKGIINANSGSNNGSGTAFSPKSAAAGVKKSIASPKNSIAWGIYFWIFFLFIVLISAFAVYKVKKRKEKLKSENLASEKGKHVVKL